MIFQDSERFVIFEDSERFCQNAQFQIFNQLFSQSQRMAATSISSSNVATMFNAFISEMSELYNHAENADIKELNSKIPIVFDERTTEAMNHVRYVTYSTSTKKFKLALCLTENKLWIDVCILTQHLTSCIDPETGKIKHAIDLKLVYDRGDKRCFFYDTPIWLQIHGLYKSVRGMFVPIADLQYYCSPYLNNLVMFMAKDFELGDSKGFMYFNAMKSGKKFSGGKIGRTQNLKGRTSGHKTNVKQRKEQIYFQISIPVSQEYRAERTWKNYIDEKNLKVIWNDCPQKLELFNKMGRQGEWFEFSNNEEEANAQVNLLIECWEGYITSEEFKLIKLGDPHFHTFSTKEALAMEVSETLEESLTESSEESQNEEPKATSSTETSKESQHEEDAKSNQ